MKRVTLKIDSSGTPFCVDNAWIKLYTDGHRKKWSWRNSESNSNPKNFTLKCFEDTLSPLVSYTFSS
jgi:hypothetical protein